MDETAQKIAQYIAFSTFEDLSPGAVSSARRSTLDTIGAMLAGSNAPGIETIVDLATGWGGTEEATLIGFERKLPVHSAVWCNGSMARALEIDDCVDFLPVHPSASAVPALLALAQLRKNISGKEFITALAIGQDLIIRLGLAVRKNAIQSGRNNLFKIFGPTAAVARALRLDPSKVQHALGIAFSHAVGDGQCALDGALSLRLQQGIVAQGSLISGLLAEKEFTGAKEFLLGRWGYLKVWEPNPRLQYLTEYLKKRFYGEQITIKPFSSCRATHPAIDLALRLSKKHELDPASIRHIKVRTSPEIHNLVATPHETKIRPESAGTAQFSIQYTVAAAIMRHDMFLAELDPKIYRDTRILDLASRIKVEPDPTFRTGSVLGRTVVEIDTEKIGIISAEIESPLGSPECPLSFEECAEKLRKCAQFAVRPPNDKTIEKITERIARLEELEDVSSLIVDLG